MSHYNPKRAFDKPILNPYLVLPQPANRIQVNNDCRSLIMSNNMMKSPLDNPTLNPLYLGPPQPALQLQANNGCSTTPMAHDSLKSPPLVALDKAVLNRYLNLPQPANRIQAEYIWIDGTGEDMRSKTRTLANSNPSELPVCTYDGSFTCQAHWENSEKLLQPVAVYRDPFRGNNNVLVLCETYDSKHEPTKSNKRRECLKAMESAAVRPEEPWFGIKQEYTLLGPDGEPLASGWPHHYGWPYFCGVGAGKAVAREVAEAHYRACLYAGVPVCAASAEVMPAHWKYQVGPSLGIAAGDDLWLSRFVLHRVAEELGVVASFHPKLVSGTGNKMGAHTNFSTKSMRAENGIEEIRRAIERMAPRHWKDLKEYNPRHDYDNPHLPLPTSIREFSSGEANRCGLGVANRNVSVRIPLTVAEQRKGYLEDRRPSSNCDPYSVTNALVRTCLIDE